MKEVSEKQHRGKERATPPVRPVFVLAPQPQHGRKWQGRAKMAHIETDLHFERTRTVAHDFGRAATARRMCAAIVAFARLPGSCGVPSVSRPPATARAPLLPLPPRLVIIPPSFQLRVTCWRLVMTLSIFCISGHGPHREDEGRKARAKAEANPNIHARRAQ